MSSSLYHNAGPGRHALPPQGTYIQNQPLPGQQYGAAPSYNYTGSLPPGQMAYNPTYTYGSPVAPDGYTHTQNQYYPSLNLPPPPPPPPHLPPQHPMQLPHQSIPYSSNGNTFPQSHQLGNHAAFYSTQVPPPPPHLTQLPPPPPLPTQLPPPPPLPISHSSHSQTSSYGNFPSNYQSSLPPPSLSASYDPSLNFYFPSTLPNLQPAQGQNAAEVVTHNTQAGGASTVAATQANWSSHSDTNIMNSTQAAWNLLLSQPSALTGLTQQMTSSKETAARASLPTDTPAMTKNAGSLDTSKPIQQGTTLKLDSKSKREQEHREKRKQDHERKLEDKKKKEMQSRSRVPKVRPTVAPLAKYTSGAGSRDGRTNKKLGSSSDKTDNRLKRPSTFVCKIKFRNGLPDTVSQPKLLQVNNDKDRYCKYAITSLDKVQKNKLLTDFNLGIPLDLLDLRIYNPPNINPPMDPEDEELLHDDENIQSAKVDSVRKKDRPTDKGVAWLVKTQYISAVNLDPAKQPLTAKQAKELKEMREGKFLESVNDREQQICSIEESFRAAKLRPVHQTKPGLEPVEILPVLPDFERWSDKYMHIVFDGEPTADSKLHSKLDHTVRDELEAQAILKSYRLPNPDDAADERFLAYMVPQVEEFHKDSIDESIEVSYAWMREYNFETRSEEPQTTSNYIFSFGDESVQYLPLQTKIALRKKRAKDGRSKEEAEVSFTIPSSVTVCQRESTQEEDEQWEASKLVLTEGVALSTGLTSQHAKRTKSVKAVASSSPKQREENDGTTHENDGTTHENEEEVDM